MEEIVKQIKENQIYQEILKDSFGGVCYMKKKEEYNYNKLLSLFEQLGDYRDNLNGIMLGVYHFLMED